MNMFITPAFAEETTLASTGTMDAAAGPMGFLGPMMPIFLVLAVFYLLVLRPQNKRLQSHSEMLKKLEKGDKVITGGGLIATVKRIANDDELVLELAEGVEVRAVRSTIMSRYTK